VSNLGSHTRYDSALGDFTKTIQLSPRDAEAFHQRGIVYWSIRKAPLALDDFTKAIELKPDYSEALCNRGIMCIASV
jgi:Flp pilus assembly protein TadD